ncbi:F-box domain-containing protein [Colletotrichum godetiae]|uniref:F-box domain-containing protein n=1 Tax=Colletotrichum godetiae TaxID=1209918 RepID=A0AAJ0AYD2_9PEZI|nr:F-box domain-containing protein [Colletotrichum godetiae]KAK1699755.1 F-box domain-containing protein [Colletotrichum godetiae]
MSPPPPQQLLLHISLLPAEILHHIFSGLEPRDLGRLPRTCRFLHSYVKGNQKLCKDVYLNALDTPKQNGLDWERELHDFVRLGRVCASDSVNEKGRTLESTSSQFSSAPPAQSRDDLPFVSDVVNRLLQHASPTGETQNDTGTHAVSRNAAALANIFRDEPARVAFLCRSSIFDRARGDIARSTSTSTRRPQSSSSSASSFSSSSASAPASASRTNPNAADDLHQQSAKLHCLYGRPIFNFGRTRSSRVYPYAACRVYDMRQYTTRTKWGPFRDDDSGRVDWEKMEAIMIVLGSNIKSQRLTAKVFSNLWEKPFAGSWSGSYVPSPGRGIRDSDLEDPYGVAGTWLRVVCFIDYNDFFHYNFPVGEAVPPVEVQRPPLDVGEATRIILMKMHVVDVQPPGEEDGKELPVVHFHGLSRSVDDSWDDNAHSQLRAIKGTVRMTKEGEVRWTTFSVFNGHARWRSEGIQIGGVGSARGVMGHWFDTIYAWRKTTRSERRVYANLRDLYRDFDPHGPCGPSAYFKVSDRAPGPKDGDDKKIDIHDFLPIMDFDAELASNEDDDEDFVVGEWGEDDDDDGDIDDEELVEDIAALAAPDLEIMDLVLNGHHLIEQ